MQSLLNAMQESTLVKRLTISRMSALALLMLATAVILSAHVNAAPATPWQEGYNNRIRLHLGAPIDKTSADLLAGVEISMPKNWKTYWRTVGEAGGIPPEFDWSQSENIASAKVLYPAPKRLVDKAGAVIGYKDEVLFPVRLKLKDPSRPAVVRATVSFGVCKEICVPVEASLELEGTSDMEASPIIDAAINRVPAVGSTGSSGPSLKKWQLVGSGDNARLVLYVTDPALNSPNKKQAKATADAFLEAPEGLYVPLPTKRDEGDELVYDVDLTAGVSLNDLEGKELTLTLTGATGQSEHKFVLN